MDWHLVFSIATFLFVLFVVWHRHDFEPMAEWMRKTERRLEDLERRIKLLERGD
ncbi:MAG: hypothetical protein FWG55_07190 [Candidatus Bathyarchaeota archaeon]|nr:hypothetical protein [Candidatus Termiticorpusculum sp.]